MSDRFLSALSVSRRLLIGNFCALLGAAVLIATPAAAAETVTIELSLKDHKFEPAEVKAKANTPIIFKLRNLDATPEEFESHSLKFEKVVTGKGAISVKVAPQKAGRYTFFGEYHEKTAQGVLIVE